jgi:hypothetical protein
LPRKLGALPPLTIFLPPQPHLQAAFDAAEGWDPLSTPFFSPFVESKLTSSSSGGLGTPDYQRLLAEALAA